MQEKLTVDDIASIRPGREKIFYLSSERARWNARCLAYQQVHTNPRPNVIRYACHNGRADKDTGCYPLAIKAIKPGQYD